MKPNYQDILNRINEEPKWFTQYGVPRYEEFDPKWRSNIHSSVVMLLLIECQECKKKFIVEVNTTRPDQGFEEAEFLHLQLWREPKDVHYGDPPRHKCDNSTIDDGYCIGNTMGSFTLEVLGVYILDDKWKWIRHKKYEVIIEE